MKVVYLDQMHWIGLAKARVNHPDGTAYRDAFQELTGAVTDGRVLLPLADVHYNETSGTASVRQRTDVALTMDRLSRYATLASREAVLRAELRYALGRWVGLSIPKPTLGTFLGRGCGFAFGEPVGRANIVGPAEARADLFARADEFVDVLERKVGDGWTYLDRSRARSGEELVIGALRDCADFRLLRGPAPADVDELRRDYGYRPETFTNLIADITKREQELADMLVQGSARREKLEDIVAARFWVWEIGDMLITLLDELGIPRQKLLDAGRSAFDQILSDMPSMQVEIAIRVANFQNGSYRWKSNDILDLAMLGRAIAYCDIVVTEKHAARQASRAKLAERFGTVVLTDITALRPLI